MINYLRLRTLLAAVIFALVLAACSGGGPFPQAHTVGKTQANGVTSMTASSDESGRRCNNNDRSSEERGGRRCVRLPVQSNTTQTLANVGPLGAQVNYQASIDKGFFDWQTISGAPQGIPLVIFGDHPIESIVVSSTQELSLTSITVTGVFSNNGSTPSLDSLSATSGGTGTFVPDPNPTILGPFLATVNGNQTTFTVTTGPSPSPSPSGGASLNTASSGLRLGGKKAWNFSLVTVTVCVPSTPTLPCNDGTTTNLRAFVGTSTLFDVLVSDSSGLLTQSYGLDVSGPCSVSTAEEDGTDTPPFYNDSPMGPNAEFEVLSGANPGTCTITARYNGNQVAQTTIFVGGGLRTRPTAPIRYTLRPPVNGPSGIGVSGKIH